MPSEETRDVEKTLAGMSLEEKVGQTIFAAAGGLLGAPHSLVRAVAKLHVGGLLYREGAIGRGALIGESRMNARHGLVVAADLERGVGERVAGGTCFPANMALAATREEAHVRRQGEITAKEVRLVDVDLVLAPVLDIHGREESPIVGTRAYSDDPEEVARLGAAFIEGALSGGCATCAKHFPGHGEALQDSHETLPVVEKGPEELRSRDLLPFARAIAAGVEAVMVGHIRIASIDGADGPPASLSPRVIGPLLREEMGFDGLVLTDALLMGGITTLMTEEEAAVKALSAGADVLLCPTEPTAVHRAVARAVQEGSLPTDRLDEAVRRILGFKSRHGLFRTGWKVWPIRDEEMAEHRAAARAAAEASVCLLRNDGGALPLPRGARTLAAIVPDRADPWAAGPFLDGLVRRAPATPLLLLPGWGEAARDRLESLAKRVDTVIWAALGRPAAWKAMTSSPVAGRSLPGKRTVLVALGSPFLLDRAPRGSAAVCAFSDDDCSQKAAVRAIFGEIPFRGRLPIDCAAGRRGDGLTLE